MADLIYTRASTDEQSTQRQTHLLDEAGLVDGAEGVRLFADPATSSKIPALERGGFRELAGYARPGDRLTIAELYPLCPDIADILAVRDWCRVHEVKLRVLSGALSGIVDLAATDATTTMLVNVLVSVGQFQRDLQNELTRDGLRRRRAAAGTDRNPRQARPAPGRRRKLRRRRTPGPAHRREVRRGQGYSLHVTALPDVHQALLAAAATLGADGASPAERKAYRIYTQRLNNAVAPGI